MGQKRWLIVLAIALAVGTGGLFAVTNLLLSDAPKEVTLPGTTPIGAQEEVAYAGTWNVDTSFGQFAPERDEFTSSWAGYRIREELAGIGANTAVGRTPDVAGSMEIGGTSITKATITVNMQTLRSDRQMRDSALRKRGIESDTYPTATFELTRPVTIPEEPDAGEKLELRATGKFTLHGVSKALTIPLEARRIANRITVVSSFRVDLDDHDIERPTTARVVSIADTGIVEMQLHFTKQS